MPGKTAYKPFCIAIPTPNVQQMGPLQSTKGDNQDLYKTIFYNKYTTI